jgi:hypothetical protein
LRRALRGVPLHFNALSRAAVLAPARTDEREWHPESRLSWGLLSRLRRQLEKGGLCRQLSYRGSNPLPVTCFERPEKRPRRTCRRIITLALQLCNDLGLPKEELFAPKHVTLQIYELLPPCICVHGTEIPRRASGSKLSQGHVALCDPIQRPCGL